MGDVVAGQVPLQLGRCSAMAIRTRKTPPGRALHEVIRRIVEVAEPERIILFGSAARGATKPHSDLDLLVVKAGPFDQSRLLGDIYARLRDVGWPVDVVLVSAEQFERYRDTHCLIIAPAVRQGREVYRARAVPA